MKKTMSQKRGFTLIELMVVVVIIAILAAIAIPAFGRYVYRARRVDGQELLLRIANAQERFYAGNNHYGSLGDIGFAGPVNSEKSYYLVTSDVVAGSTVAQAYIATAKPQGVQAADVCGDLAIDDVGIKTPLASSASSGINGSCW